MTPSQNALRRGFSIFLPAGKLWENGFDDSSFDDDGLLVNGSLSDFPEHENAGKCRPRNEVSAVFPVP